MGVSEFGLVGECGCVGVWVFECVGEYVCVSSRVRVCVPMPKYVCWELLLNYDCFAIILWFRHTPYSLRESIIPGQKDSAYVIFDFISVVSCHKCSVVYIIACIMQGSAALPIEETR